MSQRVDRTTAGQIDIFLVLLIPDADEKQGTLYLSKPSRLRGADMSFLLK